MNTSAELLGLYLVSGAFYREIGKVVTNNTR